MSNTVGSTEESRVTRGQQRWPDTELGLFTLEEESQPWRKHNLSFSRHLLGEEICLSPLGLLQQKYHRMGGLNHTHLFLTVLEAGKCKIRVLADSVSDKVPLPGLQASVFSLCPHVAGRDHLSSSSFLIIP